MPADSGTLRAGSLAVVLVLSLAAGQFLEGRAAPHLQNRVPSFTREVAPFAVLDERGNTYDIPFLGGLDVPRPQFADVDGDGDQDLFLQAYSRSIWFFENTGSRTAFRFEWRTDRFADLDIGEWFRLADLDGDGDLDVLGEEPFSFVRYYRNSGTPRAARFEYADSLRDGDGKAIYFDRQNLPAIVDLDCDNRLDLFVGRVEGIVARYEAESPGVPRFVLQEEMYEGIEVIGTIDTTGTMRHGANALAFADLDHDGDRDLFWGDFFERGMLIIENIGRTCSTPSFGGARYPLPWADSVRTSGYNAPAPVDIDSDGDLDFLMGVIGGSYNPVATSASNFFFWERTSNDRFELRTRRFLNGIDLGSESYPAGGDLDGDGDMDLLVGSKIDARHQDAGRLYLFRNEGSFTAPRFRLSDTLDVARAYSLAPELGDLDADGDLDLLVGTWNNDVLFFRNDGSRGAPRFVQDTGRTIRPERAGNTTPRLVDIDADGDLDLFLGAASGEISFFRNTGSAREPRFSLVSARMDNIDVGRRSAPAFTDLDGDGLMDMLVGSEEITLTAFRNAGTRSSPRFQPMPGFALTVHPLAAPLFINIGGRSTNDLLMGTAGGGLLYFR